MYGHSQKSEQKPTTKNFVGFHNHSPLLTMFSITDNLNLFHPPDWLYIVPKNRLGLSWNEKGAEKVPSIRHTVHILIKFNSSTKVNENSERYISELLYKLERINLGRAH